MKKNTNLRLLSEGAVMLALALVLNLLPLFRLPNGGSIDLGMIPIFFFALRWGLGWGLLEGFLFGVLQVFIEGAVAWGWQSIILDFLVAFAPLGIAGLFRSKGKLIFVGILLGCLLRFVVHYISGVTIYAIIAPTELFGLTWLNKWTYSLAYNGSYMLIDTVLCLVVFALLYRPLYKYIQALDLQTKEKKDQENNSVEAH